jgi:hypothetical protein
MRSIIKTANFPFLAMLNNGAINNHALALSVGVLKLCTTTPRIKVFKTSRIKLSYPKYPSPVNKSELHIDCEHTSYPVNHLTYR